MEYVDSNKLEAAQDIVDSLSKAKVKRVKKDAGLLEKEKFDDSKIILAEDNRQILFG